MPPFLILFELIKKKFSEIENLLSNKEKLWNEVDFTCREKYQQLGSRIRNLAVKSFIYILFTKMIFALILEYPVSLYLYGEVNLVSIAINSIFPALLMLIILAFFRVPGEENTKKIYQRLIEIIDSNQNFETQIAYMPKKPIQKKSSLIFGFRIFLKKVFGLCRRMIICAKSANINLKNFSRCQLRLCANVQSAANLQSATRKLSTLFLTRPGIGLDI